MKLVFALLVAGSVAFAQQRPNPTGFGSVLYPGTGGPPPARVPNGGFGSVLYPGTGGPPGHGFPNRAFVPPRVAHPQHGRTVIVPYPVFYGGYSYDPLADQPSYDQQAPAPSYDQQPNQYAAPSQPPVVIINQSFRPEVATPVMHDYTNQPPPPEGQPTSLAPNDEQPTIYLIAMTDHTILPAIAYWVEGDTLAYITTDGNQNRISLALVDRDFSKKLNDDRRVEFKLPKQ